MIWTDGMTLSDPSDIPRREPDNSDIVAGLHRLGNFNQRRREIFVRTHTSFVYAGNKGFSLQS